MPITCIIVEDQPPAQRVLQKYISDIGSLELLGVYSDALSALEFLRNETADLIFLDVHLPKLSGIEFLKVLSPRSSKVILTTAFSDYALEGYELDVVDYLLKPFSFERFVKAVSKATSSIGESKTASNSVSQPSENVASKIFVKSGTEYINLDFDEVLFIKSDGDYTLVQLDQIKHLISHPLRYWLDVLPAKSFCQVHKSYIVNVNKIKKVAGGQILIKEFEIPIGRTYKEGFVEQFLSE